SSPSGSRQYGCMYTSTGPVPSERMVTRSPSQTGGLFSDVGTTSMLTRCSMLPSCPVISNVASSLRGESAAACTSKWSPYQSADTFDTSPCAGPVTNFALVAPEHETVTLRDMSGRVRTVGSQQLGMPQEV